MAAFDAIAEQSGLFRVSYPEVKGYYTQPRLATVHSQPRIDRILFPTPEVEKLGWVHGPVGVEGKASDVKLGKVVSQIQDYGRAVFEVRAGYHIAVEWIFVWPMREVFGDIASVMAQHRIGCVHGVAGEHLTFWVTGTIPLRWRSDWGRDAHPISFGRKVGSR